MDEMSTLDVSALLVDILTSHLIRDGVDRQECVNECKYTGGCYSTLLNSDVDSERRIAYPFHGSMYLAHVQH